MKQQYIETGCITGTHGIRGEWRVHPWCDQPEDLLRYKTLYLDCHGTQSITVERSRVHKTMVIVKAKGVDSVEQAAAYRQQVIYVNRDDMQLAQGQYLIADLIGCQVLHEQTGEPLGEISDVSQTGANDVWHIQQNGKEFLVPAIPQVVRAVDITEGKVTLLPLKGIFEDAD